MKTKFNIGDELYYMNYTRPEKSIVTGISLFYGIDDHINKRKAPENGCLVLYVLKDKYSEAEEKDLFRTKEELINNVFGSLE